MLDYSQFMLLALDCIVKTIIGFTNLRQIVQRLLLLINLHFSLRRQHSQSLHSSKTQLKQGRDKHINIKMVRIRIHIFWFSLAQRRVASRLEVYVRSSPLILLSLMLSGLRSTVLECRIVLKIEWDRNFNFSLRMCSLHCSSL